MAKPATTPFQKFAREVGKYPPGFHVLRPGAPDEVIAEAEKKLKRELPEVYRRFLRGWNGGLLFGSGVVIFAIYRDAVEFQRDDLPVEDLVSCNGAKSSRPPERFLHVARTGSGERIALDLDHISGDDVRVVRLRGDEVDASWRTFDKWLDHEMKLGRGVYDYRGNIR